MVQAPVSVVILTHNEADNLPGCLDSLEAVSDDIHVLDSGSTDGTQELARDRNVHLHEHPFAGFGTQRNWAIDHIEHKYPWVFHLDADEQFTEPLSNEVARVTQSETPEVGYFVANRLMLGNQWLRRAGNYPTYQLRLFRLGKVRFIDFGHGQRERAEGPVGYLQEPYLHFGFSKGIEAWFAKHAGYAHREALEASANRQPLVKEFAGLFGGDRVSRRRSLKSLSYRLPLRPQLRWLHTLILKRGVLDGRAGFTYARMLSIYEAMIAVELRSTSRLHRAATEERKDSP